MSSIEKIKELGIHFYIVGHKQHGKDDVAAELAEILEDEYIGSSMIFIEEFAFDSLSFMDYAAPLELYNDRERLRPILYQLIRAYNLDDKARLSKLVFSKCPIYCGIRDLEEFMSGSRLPNTVSLWVDGSERKPLEGKDSFNIQAEHCRYHLDNNTEIKDPNDRKAYLRGALLSILDKIAHDHT